MTKDKLTTEYTLTIRPDYQGLILLVASMNGWDGQGDPKDFLGAFVNSLIKNEMKFMIRAALEKYYGISQAALITQALSDYDVSAVTETSWSQVEED